MYMFPACHIHVFAGKSGLGVRGDVILQLDWTVGEIMHTLDSLALPTTPFLYSAVTTVPS